MQRKIIIFTIILFIASSFWLFYQNEKQTDPNLNKNWWAVYFADPKSDSLAFIIENHSDKTDFHWEILADKNKIKEGDIKIAKGSFLEFLEPSSWNSRKIIIRVSSGDEKKEIYKNL